MKITLITVGKNADTAIESLIDRYVKRLSHYTRFEIKNIPDARPKKGEDGRSRNQEEGVAILNMVLPGDYVILLDERGKEPTSRGFAEIIEKHLLGGTRHVVFVVGGPFGFSDAVYARADSKIALSKMTLTHEMVRLFFVEQLYRAFTIIRGESYHHD